MDLPDGGRRRLRFFLETIPDLEETLADAMARMFASYLSTKTYFPNFDLSIGSVQIQNHGRKLAGAISNTADNLDNLPAALSDLSDLHAQTLRVEPVNFMVRVLGKFLRQCILASMVSRHPDEFTPEVHADMDKFLEDVSTVLTSKYR